MCLLIRQKLEHWLLHCLREVFQTLHGYNIKSLVV